MTGQLELKAFDRMAVARANKYYHQDVVARLKRVQALGTTITLLGLALGGSKLYFLTDGIVLGISVIAILWTVVSIGFGLSAKISLHENLFREFAELEGEFAVLNTRLENGESEQKLRSDVIRWETQFYKLEAKQPSAYSRLWKRCVERVRREKWRDQNSEPKVA